MKITRAWPLIQVGEEEYASEQLTENPTRLSYREFPVREEYRYAHTCQGHKGVGLVSVPKSRLVQSQSDSG